MKVEVEHGYDPISIRLETKEEARCMKEVMNCPIEVKLRDYVSNRRDGVSVVALRTFMKALREILITALPGGNDGKSND